ncbi:MAG TPA: TVP38/TMEM64 family protein [Stellaceae bacterium]|nr:TVP38/TMEM64 family protein [Stellaceae bacterium]
MVAFSFLHLSGRTRRRKAKEELRRWGPWVGFALVLLVLCLGWLLLPLRQWMDGLQHWFAGRGAWGVVIFGAVLLVATFLPLPDWPLPIVAGYVYGAWAFLLVYVGIGVPSILAFLAARYLARDRIRDLVERREKYRVIDKAVAKEGWQVVVLLRLSPVIPFNLQNYALGITGVPFWEYVGATLAGIVPGIAIYVYFGIFGHALGKGGSMLDWVLFAAGVVATIALGAVVTRKTKSVFAQSRRSRRRRR